MAAITEYTMPHIDYVSLEDAPASVRDAIDYSAYADKEDRHLFYEILANSPQIFPERVEYFRALMRNGVVNQRDKELAYFTVAVLTECVYPASTHGRYLVDEFGMPESEVAAIARGEFDELSDRDLLLVEFTASVIDDPTALQATNFDRLREIGFDDAAVIEYFMLINAAQTATTLTHALDIQLADKGKQPPSYVTDADWVSLS